MTSTACWHHRQGRSEGWPSIGGNLGRGWDRVCPGVDRTSAVGSIGRTPLGGRADSRRRHRRSRTPVPNADRSGRAGSATSRSATTISVAESPRDETAPRIGPSSRPWPNRHVTKPRHAAPAVQARPRPQSSSLHLVTWRFGHRREPPQRSGISSRGDSATEVRARSPDVGDSAAAAVSRAPDMHQPGRHQPDRQSDPENPENPEDPAKVACRSSCPSERRIATGVAWERLHRCATSSHVVGPGGRSGVLDLLRCEEPRQGHPDRERSPWATVPLWGRTGDDAAVTFSY
jgi:hypothetical protein